MQKSIFITGAAGGFGRACARLFADQGYFVGLYDLREAELTELACELSTNCCHGHIDITDPAACRAALAHFTRHTGGKIDVLLNNAGTTAVGAFEQLDLDKQLHVIDVNLKGTFTLTYLAFAYLKATPGATVINVASASTLHGNPELVAYSLTKRALLSFTESLDIAWAPHGISVKSVNPIYARTAMVTDFQHLHRQLPDKQIRLTPEDVARAVLRSVNGTKVHRYVGTDARFFSRIAGLLPFGFKRFVMRKVIGF